MGRLRKVLWEIYPNMAACTDRLYAVQVYDEAQLSQLGKHDLEKAGLAPEETMRICNHYHAVSGGHGLLGCMGASSYSMQQRVAYLSVCRQSS